MRHLNKRTARHFFIGASRPGATSHAEGTKPLTLLIPQRSSCWKRWQSLKSQMGLCCPTQTCQTWQQRRLRAAAVDAGAVEAEDVAEAAEAEAEAASLVRRLLRRVAHLLHRVRVHLALGILEVLVEMLAGLKKKLPHLLRLRQPCQSQTKSPTAVIHDGHA